MKKFLIYIFLLCAFIKPACFVNISSLNNILNILQIGVSLYLIIWTLKENKVHKHEVIIFFMQLVLVISSIINNCNVIDSLKDTIQLFAFVILIDKLVKEDSKKLVTVISLMLNIYILCDLLSVIIYPNGIRVGLYNSWFLGAKNNHITFILPAIFCNYLNLFIFKSSIKHKKIMFIAFLVECIYILYAVKSSTSLVVAVIYILFLFLGLKTRVVQKINMKIINILYLIIFLGIVCFQLQNNFAYLIEDVLHKDLTFTGRTIIWNDAMGYIEKSPIIGYGKESKAIRVFKFNNIAAIHCHNMILEILYRGGITMFIIFIIFWCSVSKKVNEMSNKLKVLCIVTLAMYEIEFLTEVFEFQVFIWLLILIHNYEYFNLAEKGDKNKCQELKVR